MTNLKFINFFWRAVYTFCRQGFPFVILLLCFYFLPKDEVGIYTYMFSISLAIALFADFGLSTSIGRYVAESRSSLSTITLEKVWGSGLMVLLCINLLVIALSVLYAIAVGFTEYILYIVMIALLTSVVAFFDGIYRGLKLFRDQAITMGIATVVGLVLSLWLIPENGIIGALQAHILFLSISAFGLMYFIKVPKPVFNLVATKIIINYSLIFGLAALGYWLFSRTDIMLLGLYGHYEFIAEYELITRIFLLALAPFFILGQIIAPDYSILAIEKKYQQIYSDTISYTIRTFLYAVVLATLIGVGLYASLGFFLQSFSDQIFLLILVSSFIFIFNASSATVDSGIVVSTGHARIMVIFYLILGLVNALLSFMAINLFEPISVVVVTLFSTVAMFVGARIMFLRKILENK